MSFVQRRIELTFILGTGAFGEAGTNELKIPDFLTTKGNNTATISGLRIRAHLKEIGGSALGEAQLEVYGLTRSQLNQLSAITQYAMFERNNRVIVSAGDDKDGLGVIFEGQITQAWADFDAQPDSILYLTAINAGLYLVKPASPSSYPGTADVATIMDSLARQMTLTNPDGTQSAGFTLENNGVSVIMATPYYDGTIVDQIRAAAADANIDFVILQDEKKLVITPKGIPRGTRIPVVSPATGLVGYPVHDSVGVMLTTIFNRNIKIYGKLKLESSSTNANGEWLTIAVSHDLESETPGGEWFTRVQCTNLNNPHAQPTLK